jgi:hypothetical protein
MVPSENVFEQPSFLLSCQSSEEESNAGKIEQGFGRSG